MGWAHTRGMTPPGTTGAILEERGVRGHSCCPYTCDLVPTTRTTAPPLTAGALVLSGNLGGAGGAGARGLPCPCLRGAEPTARPLRGNVLAVPNVVTGSETGTRLEQG